MMQHHRLKLGIIGLGRLWEARYRPALARARDQFEVVAVYDPVARRAELEARQLGCRPVAGLHELMRVPDLEAVALLGQAWFGLFPVEVACRFNKAVYFAIPPASDPAELARVADAIRTSGITFVPELPRRFYPATLRLRELLATRLGKPRLVEGHSRLFGYDRYSEPGPTTQVAQTALVVDPGGNLIDWCRLIFQAEPESIRREQTTVIPSAESMWGPDYEALTLRFPEGAIARISIVRHHQAEWGESSRFLPSPGFQVFAERGAAWVEMPDRIQWTDDTGTHDEHLPMEPSLGDRMCDHFCRRVRNEPSLAPTLDDALELARLVTSLDP
jgi:predicted dehydrogenase